MSPIKYGSNAGYATDFGPLFIKVCSYAPWGTKLCVNRHEWAKRQLEKKGIA